MWYDELEMFEGNPPEKGGDALDAVWIKDIHELVPGHQKYVDTFAPHQDNDGIDYPGGKPQHVYLVSQHTFNKGNRILRDFIAAKKFRLAIVDEAHGCGTASRFPSAQNDNVRKMLTGVQVCLITATPGWERPGTSKAGSNVRDRYRIALGQ